jgi:calnexin
LQESSEVPEQPDSDEYLSPQAQGNIFLAEHFDDVASFNKKWVRSEAKKDEADELIAKYDGT